MTAGFVPLAYALVLWLSVECLFQRPGMGERAWGCVLAFLLVLAAIELAKWSFPELAACVQVVAALCCMRLACDAIWGVERVNGFMARWLVAPLMDLCILAAWATRGAWQRSTRANRQR